MNQPTTVAEQGSMAPAVPMTPWEVGYPSEVPLAGRWVAWDRRRRRIIAVADSYPEVMKQVPDTDDPDVVVRTAPGFPTEVVERPFTLLEDESPNIDDDVRSVIGDDYERWLDTPHWWFGAPPRSVIGTEHERELRYLLRHIRYGIPA